MILSFLIFLGLLLFLITAKGTWQQSPWRDYSWPAGSSLTVQESLVQYWTVYCIGFYTSNFLMIRSTHLCNPTEGPGFQRSDSSPDFWLPDPEIEVTADGNKPIVQA